MSFSLVEILKTWADSAFATPHGYWAALPLMALESMIAPIPSEMVMPPMGFAVFRGTFTWYDALFAASLGSLIGSLVSYYLGYFGGRPAVVKVGRFFLLNEHHLDWTSAWFSRWGGATVFISRFVPVVRHFISIPAGLARMNLLKFCAYTVLGAALWNGFLLWLGIKLQSHWETILKYRRPLDYGVVALLVLCVVAWYWLNLRKPAPRLQTKAEKTPQQ